MYFDLEKAYDTTWRYGVMKDLHEAGLRGRMPIFIAKFLINRKFSVRIGGTLSEIQLCLIKFKNGRMKMVLNFPKQKLYVCIFAI